MRMRLRMEGDPAAAAAAGQGNLQSPPGSYRIHRWANNRTRYSLMRLGNAMWACRRRPS